MISTPILWGEEFGWRSYLQLRLFPRCPLLAAIATGLIWGIWHFSLLVRRSEFPAHPYLSLAIYPVGTILYSVFLGWLRVRTGSVWAPSFAHAAINNLGSPLLTSLFATQSDLRYVELLGFVPLASFAVLIALSGNGAQS